jgi:hypothetical protein
MSHEDRRVVVVESARPELKPQYLNLPDDEKKSDQIERNAFESDNSESDGSENRKADLDYLMSDDMKHEIDFDPFPALTVVQSKFVDELDDPSGLENVEAAQVASSKIKSSIKILKDAFKWHTHDRNDNAFDLHCEQLGH